LLVYRQSPVKEWGRCSQWARRRCQQISGQLQHCDWRY